MSSAADRQRAYKARRRQGERVLALRREYFPLVEALLVSGRIGEKAALDRNKVSIAAAEVLHDWVERWRGKG